MLNLDGGVIKNLKNMLGKDIIIDFNYDGIHGKKSFKQYQRLNAIIFSKYNKFQNKFFGKSILN